MEDPIAPTLVHSTELKDRPWEAGSPDRIVGYDFARALAILGMIIVHFSLVMSIQNLRPGWLARFTNFFDGRAAATFVVLAGAGLSLRSTRAASQADAGGLSRTRRILFKRGLFLLAIGFINLIIWPGDILRVYGISICLAACLLTASNRSLWLISLSFILGFVALLCIVDFEKNWNWATLTYHNLWTPAGLFRNLFYDGFRSVFPWTALLFIGMWLGRQDLKNPSVSKRLFLCGAGAALLSGIASRSLLLYFHKHPSGMDSETITALFGTDSIPPLPLFLISAVGVAVAVIALSNLFCERLPSNFLVRCLVPTGQMAFTWYVAHILIGLGGLALIGLTERQPLWLAIGCAFGFFSFAVLLSSLWKSKFKHGPLEWLMRRLTG